MEVIKGVVMGLVSLLEAGRQYPQLSEDITLIKDLVWMFIKLERYDDFEKVHIFTLRRFYEAEAARVIDTMDANTYLQYVSVRIDEEVSKTKGIMEKRSLRVVKTTMEEVMIKKQIQAILQRGFTAEIEKRNLESLKLMYHMLGRVACLSELRTVFGQYMCSVGERIVGSDKLIEEVSKEMISQCISFWIELHKILDHCFNSNTEFKEELRKSWKKFMNRRHSRITVNLLTKYLDDQLSGAAVSNQVPDQEVEKLLSQAMSLLCVIEDEGLFQIKYRKCLAKRLLTGRAKRIQCEIFMIGRIKAECGQTVAMLLEGMLKDMDVSKELVADYNKELETLAGPRTPPPNILRPFVLTSTMWPIVPDPNTLLLPPIVDRHQKSFTKFYSRRFKGRRLTWHMSSSTALVEARFGKGVLKELQLTAYQTLIILLFCKRPLWNMWEIRDEVGIPIEQLRRSLTPLCRDKILITSSAGKEMSEKDWFRVNDEFRSEHYRVQVSKIDETEKEDRDVSKAIEKGIENKMDATIVRLMKEHKQLRHRQLVQETIRIIKFNPSLSTFKKRIERLIDRDYLRRDEVDPQIYYYQA